VIRTSRHARRRRLGHFVAGTLVVAVVGASLTTLAIATDAFGAGEKWLGVMNRVERFLAGPVPDRPTKATVLVTEPPESTPTPIPATPKPGATPTPTPLPTPTPTPAPKRVKMDVNIVDDPDAVFVSEARSDWCAVAGVQSVLAIHDLADTSDATQREIASRVREWEAYQDSHNGEWGPAAIALALEAYGLPGYEVRAFETMTGALRDAGVAIQETHSPAILLTWRGAHTWVMTGYRGDGDPAIFKNVKISGAYILDPWYPRLSSIWGYSNPPGTLTKYEELRENFLPWKRPEGRYPERDGLYITVVPTIPRSGAG
jgi:Papain-like cysteine protease AvrRpt2